MCDVGRIEVGLLGPLELRIDGRPVVVPGPKQRIVLAALAANANRVVSTERLVESLWGDDVPRSGEHAIQQHISVIRKQIGAAGRTDPSTVVVTRSPGYALAVDDSDAETWEQALDQSHAAARRTDWSAALETLDRALGLWRGAALEDIDDSPVVRDIGLRFDEQRVTAVELRVDALLATGRPTEAVVAVEPLVASHPLRESLWSKLMLALYRSGRQADALAAYRSARFALVEGLGIEPGVELREMEAAVLQQSPQLDLALASTPGRSQTQPDEMFSTFRPDGPELGRLILPDGQHVLLWPGTSVVGRDPSAVVRLVDNRVSRLHASIEATDIGCTVRDLGSSNGTTVNGERVTDRKLADGDAIGFGGVHLTFHRGEASDDHADRYRPADEG